LTGVQGATGSTGSTGSAVLMVLLGMLLSVTFPGGNITINWSNGTSTVTFVGPNLTGSQGATGSTGSTGSAGTNGVMVLLLMFFCYLVWWYFNITCLLVNRICLLI